MNQITLPTGRTINASEFAWVDTPVNGQRDFAVVYGGFDFAEYLTPNQLKMIPDHSVESINTWFYRLHHDVTRDTEPDPDESEWTLQNAADFWSYQSGELLLKADEVIRRGQEYGAEAVQKAREFVAAVTSPEFTERARMLAAKAFRSALSLLPGGDLYFKAMDLTKTGTNAALLLLGLWVTLKLVNTADYASRR